MTETLRYTKLYHEDLDFGSGQKEVTLADGEVVSLNQIDPFRFTYAPTVGGTVDVITLSTNLPLTEYKAGQQIHFFSSGANTGAVTVNVNGLGAKSVTKNGTTALVAGDIPASSLIELTYDGTRFIVTSTGRNYATLTGSETLTNKTLTSPTITAPTVTGGATVNNDSTQTATVVAPLTVGSSTSNTPAAGIGTGILYQSESADEDPSNIGQTEFAYSDVTAGSEDSYFQVLLRVAGAALTSCYRFAATGAFNAIFTHANSAARTYTLPNYDGTLATLAGTETFTNKTLTSPTITSPTITGNTVGTDALKTSTGSASGANNVLLNVTMNDYAFFPATWDSESAIASLTTYPSTDPSNTVGRFQIPSVGGSGTHGARWRYFTATDNPVIWVAYEPGTGVIKGTWVSDDPTRNDEPGIRCPGCTSIKLTARDLESFSVLSAKASDAQAYIREKKLKMQHQAFRALQLLTNDDAPSGWLLAHCHINTTTKKLEMR